MFDLPLLNLFVAAIPTCLLLHGFTWISLIFLDIGYWAWTTWLICILIVFVLDLYSWMALYFILDAWIALACVCSLLCCVLARIDYKGDASIFPNSKKVYNSKLHPKRVADFSEPWLLQDITCYYSPVSWIERILLNAWLFGEFPIHILFLHWGQCRI